MGGQQNVIEINGKKYNAATGKLLGDSPVTKQVKKGTSIDGFAARSKPQPKPTTVAGIVKPKKSARQGQTATHAKKSVQKSTTLMRSGVKKPTAKPAKKPENTNHKSDLGKSPMRHATAKSIPKSSLVHHYNPNAKHASSVKKNIQPMAVRPATTKHAPPAKQHAASTVQTTANHKPHMSASAKMIEKSLENATAHQNPHHKLPKKRNKFAHKLGVSARTMAISSTVLAGVLLGGFFAIQNVPNLSMRVASTRAGFDATMPGYNPSGFSFKGPINYSPGKVTVSFQSNTDERNYEVTQRASNWNSDALLANYIIEDDKQYQTYLDRGRTLYIYDGSNATWVDNGIWYQVEGQSAMTTDQLVRIASSM